MINGNRSAFPMNAEGKLFCTPCTTTVAAKFGISIIYLWSIHTEVKSTEVTLEALKSAVQEQEEAMTEQDKLLSSKEEDYKTLADGKAGNTF